MTLALCILSGLGLPLVVAQFGRGTLGGLGLSSLSAWIVLLAAVLLGRRVHFVGRAAVLIGVLFFAMAMGLITVGPFFGPGLAGALGVLVAGLVLGRRAGLIALCIGIVIIVGVGALMVSGTVQGPPPQTQRMDDLSSWAREGVAFGMFAGVMAIISGYVVRRIEHGLAETARALGLIKQEQAEKTAAQTALIEAERTVAELQRLEAVGRLAGGVAHDFNNALVVLMGGAEYLAEGDLDDEQKEVLEDMQQAMAQATQLTAQLLAFGRRDVAAPRRLEPEELFQGLMRTLERVLPDDIELDLRLDDPPAFVADPTQMQQVLLNLALNARDAMPGGGKLTVRAARAADPGGGAAILIEIQDSGTGIDAAIRDKIFEPFFTTKPPGEGTGLGLSMVFGIVQRLEGSITIDSETGVGSTFSMVIPVGDLDRGEDDAADAPATPAVVGHGTILVAEDDAAVRQLMVRVLGRSGFTIVQARDAAEAYAKVESHPGPIDLLCTDGVMPGGSCKALIDVYRQRYPTAPVLVCSGHMREELVRRDIAAGVADFLPKPFTGAELVARVNTLLHLA